jgi:hypothetical protein
VPGGAVERPTAGDEPQLRVLGVAVDELCREVGLVEAAYGGDDEQRRRTVRATDLDRVVRTQLPQPEEDRRTTGPRVDVADDDSRPDGAGAGRVAVPAGLVVVRSG